MPSVNVRLTDDQHAELTAAAERNRRSLQKEMVHRLFPWPVPNTGVWDPADQHFKPDPKPGAKKK